MRNVRRTMGFAGGAALGLALIAPGARAQPATGTEAGNQALPMNVQRDLEKLHAGNKAEIQTAHEAEQRAESPEVKQLAQTLVQDHTRLDSKLNTVAQEHGVSNLEGPAYQKELSQLQSKAQQQLGNKQGEAFDRAYTKLMVEDHKQDVHKNVPQWTKDAEKADAMQVTNMLQQTDSTLQKHLQMAQQAQTAERNENSGNK